MPVAGSYEPCEGACDTNESPAGNVSAIVTPVAGLGPRFVARTVKVTVSPTSASWRSTSLSTSRSAAAVAVVRAAAESLPTTGSGSFWPVLTARFVIVPGAVTVAVRTSCAVSPTASDPTDHAPVAGSYAPWLGDVRHEVEPGRQAFRNFDAGRRIRTTVERGDRDRYLVTDEHAGRRHGLGNLDVRIAIQRRHDGRHVVRRVRVERRRGHGGHVLDRRRAAIAGRNGEGRGDGPGGAGGQHAERAGEGGRAVARVRHEHQAGRRAHRSPSRPRRPTARCWSQ